MNKTRVLMCFLVTQQALLAHAQVTADSFVGHWMTAQRDGIVELRRCPLFKDAPPTGLCGAIVWDAQVDNPKRTAPLDCNRPVFQATRFDQEAWAGGWSFDTRTNKFYSAKLRLRDGNLHARAYVGSEMNGQTEIFTRVDTVPPGCQSLKPDSIILKGK